MVLYDICTIDCVVPIKKGSIRYSIIVFEPNEPSVAYCGLSLAKKMASEKLMIINILYGQVILIDTHRLVRIPSDCGYRLKKRLEAPYYPSLATGKGPV